MASSKPVSPKLSNSQASDESQQMLAVLKAGGDLRARKVRRLRAAVRAWRYENDLKLSVALDRLLEQISNGTL